jgi:hypothetical protein
MPTSDDLIDRLTAELQPRRTVSPWLGRATLAAIAVLTIAAVAGRFGMRADFAGGRPHSVPLMSELVILSAGCAIAAALTAMARPSVGAFRGGWHWVAAVLAVLPIAALVTAAGNATERAIMYPPDGPFCLVTGSLASLASIVLLTLWLRRGAPTSPERAAWMIGIVGGAIGALATGLVCPIDAITHIGTWHAGIIVVAALASRAILPRFLRW